MASSGERTKHLQDIVQCLHHCAELEGWGLMVESSDELIKASRKLKHVASSTVDGFSPEEKTVMMMLARVLQSKSDTIQDLSSVHDPSSAGISNVKRIETALEGLLKGSMSAATIETDLADMLLSNPGGQEGDLEHQLVMAGDECSKTLQATSGSVVSRRGNMLPGLSYLTITIDNIGIKNSNDYLDPYITVTVKSMLGEDIEPPQDTAVTNKGDSTCIRFGESVLVKTPIEDMPGGAAIFFEFKHYKPSKKSVSTKCFSFMEMDEVKPGKAVLEIYKKPTDFRRKKLYLHSVKPLYLHLTLTVDKPS